MTKTTRLAKGLRLLAAFALLGAILACGGSDEDDTPPPVTNPTPPPQPVQQPVQPAQPTTTMVNLRPGFLPDPHTATGTAGGPLRANTLDTTCRGNVPNAPQHTMTLADDFRNLKIMVNSNADTTLVIREPNGNYRCNDDSEGLRPAIEGAFAAGSYQIWVGVFAGTPTPYTIGFTEISSNQSANLPLP